MTTTRQAIVKTFGDGAFYVLITDDAAHVTQEWADLHSVRYESIERANAKRDEIATLLGGQS